MLRAYLECGHVYETGFLTADEKDIQITYCPNCKKSVRISRAVERVHPPDSNKVWVDGAEIKFVSKPMLEEKEAEEVQEA